ncbi:MAG: hypothetical protein KBD60_12675 [Sterolibacterium sp.]|jgi:hypothetical protein|nr:hypothetical protein [Sterolibacterium sp.]
MMPEPAMRPRHALLALLLPACLTLTACDLLGDEAQAQAIAAKEAEGRAVGAGCRHTGRSLEDCYSLNPKASKSAVFAGWRDMDGYMRDNKIEIVPTAAAQAKPAEEAHAEGDAAKSASSTSSTSSSNPNKPGTAPAGKAEAGKEKPGSAQAKAAAH